MELDRIEDLLKLMTEYGVAELGIEEDSSAVHLRLAEASGLGVAPMVAASPVAAVPAAVAEVDQGFAEVKSPMVGTFYRAPKPGSPSFVNVGDRVNLGQTLCIVEAMKLMNEIEAEIGGTVRKVLTDDAQPVQFGQVLFHIEAD
jgi:acetyl-CoA carboxylase biotin carboxyl carrier protein